VALAHTLHRCQQLRLGPFIDALGILSARAAPQALERRFYTAWIESVTGRSPALVAFSGARRDELIARYRELDGATRRASLAHAAGGAALPGRRIATAQGGAGEASQVGALRREMEKRRRLKPLRKLFAEIPVVLQALKPCFLMSPLSVSTFLKPGALEFDLVVFDEASQLPTPQAVPAILRAKQVVVAGDRNQLPPTSFFESSLIFDEDAGEAALREELEPLESLLDDCVAIFPTFEQAHLRWHYRSRDERLIKFSNHYFYRDRPLITFPSVAADPEDQGVSIIHVPDGLWDRGGSRTNRAEARRVAQIVVEQLSRHPGRSLGVVAMNVTQREAIEEEIEALLPSHPDLAPLLDPQRPEPFFIKALENVQGDERDTMVISVGYARSTTGALAYNFGPLNLEGGWRRLNVLVTRARWQTILVTSLRSRELAGVNPENRGAVALRNFIAYAEQGAALPAEPAAVTDAETNDFEDAVAEALRERGFHVDQQVGASAYRIDMAIRDPRDPRRYLLGVECDGATYHGSRTARDRDLLRQEVLREQGWRLYRVWSTEWFRDRETALARLLRAVEQAREAPVEDSVPAPPPQQVKPTTAPEDDPGSGAGRAPESGAASVERRFPPAEPYRKYRASGRREVMLERESASDLVDQIVRVVDAEGPIHREVALERLKELNGVDRAGANVQRNVERAIAVAISRGRLAQRGDDFLGLPGAQVRVFRLPGDGVTRALAQIAPEEIALAVLHKVEDQFGYQRDALPRAVAELLGFDRLPSGGAQVVGTVVDSLVERGILTVSGPYVYAGRERGIST
jgi:very-short-patch-repair endonuclease